MAKSVIKRGLDKSGAVVTDLVYLFGVAYAVLVGCKTNNCPYVVLIQICRGRRRSRLDTVALVQFKVPFPETRLSDGA